jgi:hypothetical protein
MDGENKSQLAKDLAHALFVCKLRDDLSELVDDARVQDMIDIRKTIYASYIKATVLLACAIADSKDIKLAGGNG